MTIKSVPLLALRAGVFADRLGSRNRAFYVWIKLHYRFRILE
jgi:hypothetical protein